MNENDFENTACMDIYADRNAEKQNAAPQNSEKRLSNSETNNNNAQQHDSVNEQAKDNTFTSKFKNVLFWVVIIAIFVGIPCFSIIIRLVFRFDEIKSFVYTVGNGNWIRGAIILPFAVIGAINTIRGFIKNCDTDGEKFNIETNWKIGLYFLINIAGQIAFFWLMGIWIFKIN